jgi:hypothetical protein
MAGIVNVSAFLQLTDTSNDMIPFAISIPGANFAQTGTGYLSGIQSIGTVAEEFETGDITSAFAWSFFRNLHPSDTVQIGIDSGGGFDPFASLAPGQWAILPLAAGPLGKSLGAGAIQVQYAIIKA